MDEEGLMRMRSGSLSL